MSALKKPFFILDDYKTAFSLFCCIYGIGTLAIPTNFSRSGVPIAVVALFFMGFANTYALFVLSKVLLLAPKRVKTYSDLGEWCMGIWGRYLTVIAQMANCLLVPCAFLVLGGTLLNDLFPDAFSKTTWICLMALTVLPVCLIPTLKEGAGSAFTGCLGTIIADVIGVAVILHAMDGHPSVPKPDVKFSEVANAFGNLSLAYGGAIIIPALQRQHSFPTRMPRVILATSVLITACFLVLGALGYSAVGCQNSGNLLYAIYPSATTGLTSLGFSPAWGPVVLAFLGMQVHISIAFSVIISPAFYLFERFLLGMHKRKTSDFDDPDQVYISVQTPKSQTIEADKEEKDEKVPFPRNSIVSVADVEKESLEYDHEISEYKGANVIKYVILRIVVIVLMVLVSISWENRFSDLQTFIGASCHAIICILLPILFYLVKCWDSVRLYEKIPAIVTFIIILIFGGYSTYTSGKQLFHPTSSSVKFPFCYPEYQTTIYYIKNTTSS